MTRIFSVPLDVYHAAACDYIRHTWQEKVVVDTPDTVITMTMPTDELVGRLSCIINRRECVKRMLAIESRDESYSRMQSSLSELSCIYMLQSELLKHAALIINGVHTQHPYSSWCMAYDGDCGMVGSEHTASLAWLARDDFSQSIWDSMMDMSSVTLGFDPTMSQVKEFYLISGMCTPDCVSDAERDEARQFVEMIFDRFKRQFIDALDNRMSFLVRYKCASDVRDAARHVCLSHKVLTREELDAIPRDVDPIPHDADHWKRLVDRIGIDTMCKTVKAGIKDSKKPMIDVDENDVYHISESLDAWVAFAVNELITHGLKRVNDLCV